MLNRNLAFVYPIKDKEKEKVQIRFYFNAVPYSGTVSGYIPGNRYEFDVLGCEIYSNPSTMKPVGDKDIGSILGACYNFAYFYSKNCRYSDKLLSDEKINRIKDSLKSAINITDEDIKKELNRGYNEAYAGSSKLKGLSNTADIASEAASAAKSKAGQVAKGAASGVETVAIKAGGVALAAKNVATSRISSYLDLVKK